MKAQWSRLARFWCHFMHPAPMWPMKGRYQCPTCLRTYPVPWEQGACAAKQPERGEILAAAPAQPVLS